MMGSGSMWFMDVAALGGWTAKGTAKVLQDRLAGLPPDQMPPWMEGQTAQKVEEILTKVIIDAVEASHNIQQYMDEQRAKGRDFEEIYKEIKPYLDHVSRPLEDEMNDGVHLGPGEDEAFQEVPNLAETAAKKEARRKAAPHRNVASWPDDMFLRRAEGPHAGEEEEEERSATTGHKAPRVPPPDELSAADLEEPLLLVGSCNAWSAEEARRLHKFAMCDPARHESVLRVKVPPGGLFFQILSEVKHWQWRLFPSHKGTLKRGEELALPAGLASGKNADDKAHGRDFRVKSTGGYTFVDIHVALCTELGARVWFTEPDESEAPPAITFPGME